MRVRVPKGSCCELSEISLLHCYTDRTREHYANTPTPVDPAYTQPPSATGTSPALDPGKPRRASPISVQSELNLAPIAPSRPLDLDRARPRRVQLRVQARCVRRVLKAHGIYDNSAISSGGNHCVSRVAADRGSVGFTRCNCKWWAIILWRRAMDNPGVSSSARRSDKRKPCSSSALDQR